MVLVPQDIVTESNKFDLVGFIPLLRERIYSNNQYARQFIISWVSSCGMTLVLSSPLLRCSQRGDSAAGRGCKTFVLKKVPVKAIEQL